MPTSMLSDQLSLATLRIETGHPASEIVVLDPQLQVAARGIGTLVTQQVPGVYKVRVRLGRETTDKLIFLNGDTTEWIAPPAFASPAPLGATTLTHEYHVAAAEKYSRQPMVTVGTGSSIFILVRYFTPTGRTPRLQDNPAHGLMLRNLFDNQLVDLATSSVTGPPPDAWAACHVRLAPGAYVLECETAQGPIARTIIASPNWQTQVFLIRSQPASPAATDDAPASGIFETGTVLMSRNGFDPNSEDLHMTELARIALVDERPILGGILRDLLTSKFTNPMQGILGAHLMLLARERAAVVPRRAQGSMRTVVRDPEDPFDQGLFDTVVSNLRSLVGPDHSDVEALSLQCGDPARRTTQVFVVPPMLRRSWSLIVEASNEHPYILDNVLWSRVMARTVSTVFLSWRVVTDNVRAEFEASMREIVEARRKMRPPGARAADGGPAFKAMAPDVSPGTAAAGPSDDVRRQLSVDLDIPRRALDQFLGGT
jgi:hypothetical protein